ncbi:MAG: NADP-dependent phosphogluconate dehydrogenase [Candidatus Eremiobacteraeota bacterium]|nr:NADP-dependent phosphogluconate dehydrogenase [Candidatus Eremiobacteraeota bacterium]
MDKMDVGLIGLAVMGQNLVLNIENQGYSVGVFNRTSSKTEDFIKNRAGDKKIKPAYSVKEFTDMLAVPRKIIIMVKAGKPVDDTIEQLLPFLDQGDIIIDGGNSHFQDTGRRSRILTDKGFLFLGVGISGGEEGALKGPCIMPGGSETAYNLVKDIFLKIAASVDGNPCCTYIGPGNSGHFVKMVHNGIEYGDMQLIAETYDFLRNGLGLSIDEIRQVFLEWKEGELGSYLMDITAEILGVIDPETGKPMVDVILDKAKQKGTGKWTSITALGLGVPVPVIDSAVFARNISAFKNERLNASRILKGPVKKIDRDKNRIIKEAHDALLCSRITTYAQGMTLLSWASKEYGYNLKLHEIARIWKGGCIIRARLLEPIRIAFLGDPDLPNLYLNDYFSKILVEKQDNWRKRVIHGIETGIPCPATVAALEYYDCYRAEKLPANLIQAQRDYFGAHTYERTDREGIFHTTWSEL